MQNFSLLSSAASDESTRDGEDESGAREEEMLLGTRGTQREGLREYMGMLIQLVISLRLQQLF